VCGTRTRARVLVHPEGDLARCDGCGLVSVDPLPSAGGALSGYDERYFRGEHGYRDYEAEAALFRREFRRRMRALRAAGLSGTLVDVGCATGHALAEAALAGFSPRGFEPVERAAAAARARTGAPVEAVPLEQARVAPGSAGVVTFFDVLEHLVDPVAALARARTWLAPGGAVAATVPDFGGAWARTTGRRWPFVVPWEHLHYFTRTTLARTLAAAGFQPPVFSTVGVPVSFGSIARRVPLLGRRLEALLGARADRGLSLPTGGLFAVARPRREPFLPQAGAAGPRLPAQAPEEEDRPPVRAVEPRVGVEPAVEGAAEPLVRRREHDEPEEGEEEPLEHGQDEPDRAEDQEQDARDVEEDAHPERVVRQVCEARRAPQRHARDGHRQARRRDGVVGLKAHRTATLRGLAGMPAPGGCRPRPRGWRASGGGLACERTERRRSRLARARPGRSRS
jgi:SAM-dependent methyltransferase